MKAELKKPVILIKELGAESDDNPKHWDAALMISGYNFWTVPKRGKSKGKRVTAAMGLAAVDGMCDPRGRYIIACACHVTKICSTFYCRISFLISFFVQFLKPDC